MSLNHSAFSLRIFDSLPVLEVIMGCIGPLWARVLFVDIVEAQPIAARDIHNRPSHSIVFFLTVNRGKITTPFIAVLKGFSP
jgi:hypothetical protein